MIFIYCVLPKISIDVRTKHEFTNPCYRKTPLKLPWATKTLKPIISKA